MVVANACFDRTRSILSAETRLLDFSVKVSQYSLIRLHILMLESIWVPSRQQHRNTRRPRHLHPPRRRRCLLLQDHAPAVHNAPRNIVVPRNHDEPLQSAGSLARRE
jgi:hypothetical protein